MTVLIRPANFWFDRLTAHRREAAADELPVALATENGAGSIAKVPKGRQISIRIDRPFGTKSQWLLHVA